MRFIDIYADDTPELIDVLANTPQMQRLSDVGMHCGCNYTGFPIYAGGVRDSRLSHSLGVARIVWNFTGDIRQAIAGLLHDIATPVFAHTIDFLNKDYLTQESTEDETLNIIKSSKEIMGILNEQGISITDVSDYHKYPIADNDTPMLSADRLEYTLSTAYALYKVDTQVLKNIYSDIFVAKNERGDDELCFASLKSACAFTDISVRNSHLFVSDAERFAMQYLADIVKQAIALGVLNPTDLHTTEAEVIAKLRGQSETAALWERYSSISVVSVSDMQLKDRYCVNIPAKKRYIDPLVCVEGNIRRISAADDTAREKINGFVEVNFDKWLFAGY